MWYQDTSSHQKCCSYDGINLVRKVYVSILAIRVQDKFIYGSDQLGMGIGGPQKTLIDK